MHGQFNMNVVEDYPIITIFKYINSKIEQKSGTFFYKECAVLLYHRSVKWRKDSISYLGRGKLGQNFAEPIGMFN
jgi:hypothetical protein